MVRKKESAGIIGKSAIEKRTDTYEFSSKADLIAFFSAILPEKTVRNTIREIKKTFIRRSGISVHENGLQFLKKCESILIRHYRNMMNIPKE